MSSPIVWTYDDGALRPSTPFMARLAGQQFSDGERYRMVVEEERSAASHRHYFASVNEAWTNLPDHLAERFPSSEHLRRYALIKAGYCDSASIVASSKAEAQRIAAFMRPLDEFQIVTVSDATVTRYSARSQSMKAMGKEQFNASKEAVLNVISDMIGTDAGSLNQARAA